MLRILPYIKFLCSSLIILLCFRFGFAVWQIEHFSSSEQYLQLLFNGFRIDFSALSYLLIVPVLIQLALLFTHIKINSWLLVVKCWLTLCFFIVIFFELVTPEFINEYGLRPNRLFIEYLAYPKEVSSMLFSGHLMAVILVLILSVVSTYIFYQFGLSHILKPDKKQRDGKWDSIAQHSFFLMVLLLAARGTLAHRPINPSLVYFDQDPLINSLTLNSAYSVAFALKQIGKEKDAAKIYGNMSEQEVINIVRKETGLPKDAFVDKALPSAAKRVATYQGKPKNLVIVLEESLGAQFVSSLGGLALTPYLDQLIEQGWSFEQLYATGTRSVRGIEAVVTGYTPTPARSVVKLSKSQQHFFTLANLLQSQGYNTQFIYGGESHFDNMKSFFLGNGFSDIVDLPKFQHPDFVASWGASDGDLFKQADIELNKLHQQNTPFFSLIFTSSNHDPFEIPHNKVKAFNYSNQQLEQYSDQELMRHRAIQYADYALGQFIEKAKSQPYWDNTLFLIVADHDARALGKELVPVKNFHIPGVILNSAYDGNKEKELVSQIDLAPTLLSLMGINAVTPMLGADLTQESSQPRVMMQYENNFAYIKNDQAVILQPGKSPSFYHFEKSNKTLKLTSPTPELTKVALAHVLWGSLAYEKQWYQLPQTH